MIFKKKIHGNMMFSVNALKKLLWDMIFLVLSGKMYFFFPKIRSYSLDGKWKIIFLNKKIHGNTTCIFDTVYSVRIVILFTTNMILPVCHKSKYGVLTKNTLKDDISGIIEKDEDMVFLLTEKLKMIKKITQLNAQRSVCLCFAFTGINFRGMFHHVSDVDYDENTFESIRTRICSSTNWLNSYMIGRTSATNVSNTSNKLVIINLPSLICKNLRTAISIFTPFFKVTFICYRGN